MEHLQSLVAGQLDSIGSYLDTAAANLRCAQGLPHADGIDESHLISILDTWAKEVRDYTFRKACMDEFLDHPEHYRTSLAYFCILAMITYLQRAKNVRYNPDRILDPTFQAPNCLKPDFTDSRDLFIHGLIHTTPTLDDAPGGTCASMPVLYVAIGRRLGYPLVLVEAPEHLFVRWDDPAGERWLTDDGQIFPYAGDAFNIDASGLGFNGPPDEFYLHWPRPWTDEEKRWDCYLKPMSPRQELASFLVTRGECLEDLHRWDEAFQAFQWAQQLASDDERYKRKITQTLAKTTLAASGVLNSLFDRPCERAARGATSSIEIDRTHGPSCRCFHCQQAIETQLGISGDFGHGPSCQCAHCRANRQATHPAMNNAHSLGHGPQCVARMCRGNPGLRRERAENDFPQLVHMQPTFTKQQKQLPGD